MNTENLDPLPFIQTSFGLVGIAVIALIAWLFWQRRQMQHMLAIMEEHPLKEDSTHEA